MAKFLGKISFSIFSRKCTNFLQENFIIFTGKFTRGLGQKHKKNYPVDANVKEKRKLYSSPSILHHRTCGDPEGNNFNASVCRPSIRGGFDGRRMQVFDPVLQWPYLKGSSNQVSSDVVIKGSSNQVSSDLVIKGSSIKWSGNQRIKW